MFGRTFPRCSQRFTRLLKFRVPRGVFAFAGRPTMGGVAGFVGGTVASGVTVASCYSFLSEKVQSPPFNLQGLRSDIEDLIADKMSLGPLFVRLAWHEAGSWDCRRKDGAPNSASMRFQPECAYGGNNGLGAARDALEPLKKKYPEISYADLWVLASYVAIEYMGGPAIPFSWGRRDAVSGKECGPDGRLPDAAQTQKHVRDVFSRLGFTDRETVALIGAHTCGECHLQNSGFVGPWTHDKYGFDNSFFTHLLKEEWVVNPGVENLQFMDRETKNLMMLPADVALLVDPGFLKFVNMYAADNELWCKDFASAFEKLTSAGTRNLVKVPAEQK